MKKLILFILLYTPVIISYAQFNKGNVVIGGSTNLSASFSTAKSKSGGTTSTLGKYNNFSIEPQAGYFVMDNLNIGTGLFLSTSSYKSDDSSNESSSTSVSLTPFVRYYLNRFYAQGSFGFGTNKTKNTFAGSTSESKDRLSSWSVVGGYVFLIGNAISFEPQLGYSSSSRKFDSDNNGITSGISFGIGVYGYINRFRSDKK